MLRANACAVNDIMFAVKSWYRQTACIVAQHTSYNINTNLNAKCSSDVNPLADCSCTGSVYRSSDDHVHCIDSPLVLHKEEDQPVIPAAHPCCCAKAGSWISFAATRSMAVGQQNGLD